VKAAILASCDTSTLPNIPQATDTGSPNLFTSFENTFGSGFLRVDWLGDLCQRLPASQCLVTEVPFSGNTHTVTYTPAGAAAGTFFTAVAVWNRIDGDHTDLDLTVDCLNGTSTLKSFTTDRRSGIYEKLTFPLPTGTTQIRVHLVRHSGLSSLPVQLVVRPLPIPTTARPRLLAAASESYPQPASCATTLLDQRVQRTLPEWPETQTQSRISYAEAYGSGGWQRNFSSTTPGVIYTGPRLERIAVSATTPPVSEILEMWFGEQHFAGQGAFELRGLALRMWRGGIHSREVSPPSMGVRVAVTRNNYLPDGITGNAIQGLSKTYLNITPQGVSSSVGAPMITPRRPDDWTLYIPFPELSASTPGWLTIPPDMTGKGLYVQLKLSANDITLSGLDWVADNSPAGWRNSFGMRRWRLTGGQAPLSPGVDAMGNSLVIGLIGGDSSPRPLTPTIELAGDPHAGGSFLLRLSNFPVLPQGTVSAWYSLQLTPPSGTSRCDWRLGGLPINLASLSLTQPAPLGVEFTVPISNSFVGKELFFQAVHDQFLFSAPSPVFSNALRVRIGGHH
jgi:hypothetical protein